MHRSNCCRSRQKVSISRVLDVTMIATTVGCAAAANMIFPGVGSAVIGAVLGAFIGLCATKAA